MVMELLYCSWYYHLEMQLFMSYESPSVSISLLSGKHLLVVGYDK